MANVDGAVRSWWTAALLGQQTSAHPIFGARLNVRVEGDVVVLSGTVDSAEEAEELERQARAIDTVSSVVNHLTVAPNPEIYHLQTVLAVFPDRNAAELACNAMATWTIHDDAAPVVVERGEDGRRVLAERARAAALSAEDVAPFVEALDEGKVLLLERVPEDDALRVISALEGTRAEMIRTLPPEPGATDRG